MPSSLVKVHLLGVDDVPLMRSMLDMFGKAFNEPQTFSLMQPDTAYLKRLLEGDTFIALAALEGRAVVGAIGAYVLHKFEQDRREIYVYDLAVAQAHRRQGIASLLLEALKTIAFERRAALIFIQADEGDEPAISLYAKFGTRANVVHFDIAT
jgi:aminoglycoside 3-N-acetyltransferase I